MPSDIRVKYLESRGKLKEIEYEDFCTQNEENRTSFIDNDYGKPVTIKGSGSKVEAPSIKFVHDGEDYSILLEDYSIIKGDTTLLVTSVVDLTKHSMTKCTIM